MNGDESGTVPLPAGGGEMGRLIRAQDWRATPLGAPDGWPQVLLVLVDLMLSSNQPMFIVWGLERTILYNDPYAQILANKHPAALGQPFHEVWHEIWEPDLKPIVEAAYAGQSLHMDDIPLMMLRKGYLEETHFSFSYTPVRGPDGRVEGFFCPCTEITEQVLEERRARLRAELTERLRVQDDLSELTAEVAALIGRHLGAARAAFAEIDAAGEQADAARDWTDGSLPSVAGRHRLDRLGARVLAELRAGRSVAIPDLPPPALDTPGTAPPARATLHVPYLRDGRLAALLSVQATAPRPWPAPDVALVEEVVERLWLAIERARARAAERESAAELRRARDALALATEASRLGWGTWDFPTATVRLDARGRALFDLDEGDESIASLFSRLHPEDVVAMTAEVEACLAEDRPFDLEYRIRHRDGRTIHVHGTGIFTADAQGAPLHGTGFVRDITERTLAEQHQNMLMAELDHRVKNILAVVQSITRQSLRRGQQIGPEAAERLVGRIAALARSHTLLARSRWRGAALETLVEATLAPYRGEEGARIDAAGPPLRVTPKAAQTLALVLHEMVTNAAKYGALSRPEGRVRVRWNFEPAPAPGAAERLRFAWSESGGPMLMGPPARRGFGSLLIERTLAHDLGGEVALDYAPTGFGAVLALPLDKLRAEEDGPAASGPARPAVQGDPAALAGLRVLLAEDEHLVGQETAAALRAAGCQVLGPLATVAEAMEAAEAGRADAAVLDVNLDGALIWPVARVLHARGTPLVFATGYAGSVAVPAELSPAHWVEKPFDAARLVAALAAAVAQATPERGAERAAGPGDEGRAARE